jgi:ABC-type multidrug transport system ATPase subunit
MRTVATLQDAVSGENRLDDLDVLKRKDDVRRILGYLPQEFGVYPKMPGDGHTGSPCRHERHPESR